LIFYDEAKGSERFMPRAFEQSGIQQLFLG
jgi:hypothetical protein